jgi:hypothetical protein
MTKTELKIAKENYFLLSKKISSLSANSLIKETTEEQEARIKYLLKPKNYGKFFDYYFGKDSGMALGDAQTPKFHINDYVKLYNDPFIRQLLKKFRGAGKSIQGNVGKVTHLKENDMTFFSIIIGANGDLAKILLSDLQAHLENNQRYIKDFGSQISYGDWSDGDFETKDGKHFKALGLNQPFRGLRFGSYRPDLAILDDCEDRDRAKRPEMIRKYGEKITGDLVKAFHRKRGRLMGNNNYIVKDGLLDYLKEQWKESPHFHESITNLATKNITKYNYNDVKDWQPSWPERDTKDEVIRIVLADDYYTSQREDFNNPIEEGKLFKEDDIIKRAVHHRETFDGFMVHWDLSYTSTGDYKAGVLLGVKGINLTVLEVFCQKCETPSAMETHFKWVEKYLSTFGIVPLSFYDASVAQQAVYTPVIQQIAEDNKSSFMPMPMHQQGDKHNRIEATLTNIFHRGILSWDETLEQRSKKDYGAAEKQLKAFEKGVKIDDFPDTLERACALAQMYFGYSKDENASKPHIGKRKRRRRV